MKTLIGVIAAVCAALAATVAMAQDPLPSRPADPYVARVQQLEQQVFERDNEILRLSTEWATCRQSLDVTTLTGQAVDLVRRCEAVYGVKCTWDDKARRVVIEKKEQE